MSKKIFLFSGTSNIQLARKIALNAKINLGRLTIKKFTDGETYVNVHEVVSGKNCFVLQSCSDPANENFMELMIIIDALKSLKAGKITAVLPFYPYRRQERKIEKGESVTAKLCATLIKSAGADRIIALDLHSKTIENFFKVPYNHLTAFHLFLDYFSKKKIKNAAVIAPDFGAFSVNKKLAKELEMPCSYIKKYRMGKHDEVKKMELEMDVKGKDIIMLDDEISTGGTLVAASRLLKKSGAGKIHFACTHPVLAARAVSRLKRSAISEIVVTDSIYLPKEKRMNKIKILSVAGLISKEIKNNN
jgi:ribose-phosphate pyrophosphokinase